MQIMESYPGRAELDGDVLGEGKNTKVSRGQDEARMPEK